jgi:hypothetical protein
MGGSKKTNSELIIFLINAFHYRCDYVIIFIEKDGCRLVVWDPKKVVTNEIFKTVDAAKEAFLDLYQHFAYRENETPVWSPPYPPYPEWMKEKREALAAGRGCKPLLPRRDYRKYEKTLPIAT